MRTFIPSPHAKGRFSEAVVADGTVYIAGCIAVDDAGQMIAGGIEAQTKRAIEKIAKTMEKVGGSLSDVVRTTIYLAKREDYQAFNDCYAAYFLNDPPARSTFIVSFPRTDILIEIDSVAVLPKSTKG